MICHREGDGEDHDEAFRCFGCQRPVCGICARVENSEWLCPDCKPDYGVCKRCASPLRSDVLCVACG